MQYAHSARARARVRVLDWREHRARTYMYVVRGARVPGMAMRKRLSKPRSASLNQQKFCVVEGGRRGLAHFLT